jgi:hypothetical protein
MRRVLIIDTSVLCVWLKIPGKDECGSANDRWDYRRVDAMFTREKNEGTTLVLPLTTIIETGNHIAQAADLRYEKARELANMMKMAADQTTPWAAFTEQSDLWTADGLNRLSNEWPELAAKKLSIGDCTIKQVAEFYAKAGYEVEIATGDAGLKAYQPSRPTPVPRRRQ